MQLPRRGSPAVPRTASPLFVANAPILPELGGWRSLVMGHFVRSQFMRVQNLALMLTLLAACGKREAAAPATIQSRVALARAATCDSLQQQVQDTAVRQMRSELDAAKKGMGWLGGISTGAGGATPQAAAAPASYTTTNTQVAGVDESDFVKNDGTRILVLSGRTLFTAASWPPQSLSIAGQLEIEGWPSTMFLEGNRAVVFSSIWTVPPGGSMGPGGAPAAALCPSNGCYWGWSTTKDRKSV